MDFGVILEKSLCGSDRWLQPHAEFAPSALTAAFLTLNH